MYDRPGSRSAILTHVFLTEFLFHKIQSFGPHVPTDERYRQRDFYLKKRARRICGGLLNHIYVRIVFSDNFSRNRSIHKGRIK